MISIPQHESMQKGSLSELYGKNSDGIWDAVSTYGAPCSANRINMVAIVMSMIIFV
jgi:hypothetical protein